LHTERGRPIVQTIMQKNASYSVTHALRKDGLDRLTILNKANTPKEAGFNVFESDPHFRQSSETVRHYSLSAGLVDRRLATIRNHDFKALLSSGDGCR
jgi:hypothetical protein